MGWKAESLEKAAVIRGLRKCFPHPLTPPHIPGVFITDTDSETPIHVCITNCDVEKQNLSFQAG